MFNNLIKVASGIIAVLVGTMIPVIAQFGSNDSMQIEDFKVRDVRQPVRPKDFKPFVYPSSLTLKEKYSEEIMSKSAQEMARVNQVNLRSGYYKATWESLDRHVVPDWYQDAKFGMFVDWGLYSIPAYAPVGYPDWYLWRMNTDTKEYHNKYWGEDFRADDFISLFTAEDFNAEYLAEVAKEAGMKYVVPFLKHHDGFCLWNSSYTLRNSMEMGPRRDIAKEWMDALKKRDLKYGFYYSIDDWNYPIIGADNQVQVRQWHATDGSITNSITYYKVDPYIEEKWERMQLSGKIPVRDFYNEYINPAAIEFIDKYDPDLIWGDGDWIFDADVRNTRALIAYYYNQAKGRKEVAFNDAYGCSRLVPTLGMGPDHLPHGDFNRSEALYSADKNLNYDKPWEECSGLSHSFGYNWRETDSDVRSAKELLTMLIDVVAGGGNLLLITNLTATGQLDPLLAERLKVVGAWLEVNGEAIYATRRWIYSTEKVTRFTRSKDGRFVYAISTIWPGQIFTSNFIKPKPGSKITMLGSKDLLQWKIMDGRLEVNIPGKFQDEKKRPVENAWVFKIEIAQ